MFWNQLFWWSVETFLPVLFFVEAVINVNGLATQTVFCYGMQQAFDFGFLVPKGSEYLSRSVAQCLPGG